MLEESRSNLSPREKFYLESIYIKIDHLEAHLQKLNILKRIDVCLYQDTNKITIEFECEDPIYAKALVHVIQWGCYVKEACLKYEFERSLINNPEVDTLSNNFFTAALESILEKFKKECLRDYIVNVAIDDFYRLRSKNITEKDYRKLKDDIRYTDDVIQYIANIRTIIKNAHGRVCLFGQRYNQFFKVGHPPEFMSSITEDETEAEERKNNYELNTRF